MSGTVCIQFGMRMGKNGNYFAGIMGTLSRRVPTTGNGNENEITGIGGTWYAASYSCTVLVFNRPK